MKNPDLKITKRHLPHFQLEDSVYFVTFRALKHNLSKSDQKIIYDHILLGDRKYYSLIAFVIIPNHVHLLLQSDFGFDISTIMKGIKDVSAKKINQNNSTSGSIWLNESFDRIIRNDSELFEKLKYMLDNPVKWNLITNGWDYEGWYFNEMYSFPE